MPAELRVYQSLWAMAEAGTTVAALFDRVVEAGFDGMMLDLGAISLAEADAALPHFERTGLRGLVTAFPASADDLRAALGLAAALQAPFLTVVARIASPHAAEVAAELHQWIGIAAAEGIPLHFETHRNSITNDLVPTLALLEAVPEMRLAADLSHYIAGQGILAPPTPATRDRIMQILARSDSFQGRIATSNHIQVPIRFPQHRRWLDLALQWWSEGFRLWRQRSDAGESLAFTCELGPPDYAITDAEGRELSDRWEEALMLRDMVRALWAEGVAFPNGPALS